jgi:hypothetical protein
MLRLVPRAAFLALALGLLGCGGRTPVNTAPPPAATTTVKAGDLLKEYGANAVAADLKYKGKPLQVSGKFGTAQKAPLLGYAVQVLPEDAEDLNLSGVECFILESEKEEVAKLKPGDKVTLQGTCDGQVVGQIKLSKCTIIK